MYGHDDDDELIELPKVNFKFESKQEVAAVHHPTVKNEKAESVEVVETKAELEVKEHESMGEEKKNRE